MAVHWKLTTQDVALTVSFAALYVVFCFLPISPIIGLPGKAVTAAAIAAPLIGIVLGVYLGTLSTILGGLIGFFVGFLSPSSFVSGVVAALCAAMLNDGKRGLCIFTYFSLLFLFGFYPFVGPVWLYLPLMWFQIAGFLVLISPIQSVATESLNSDNNSKVLSAFFITSLTSTLAGQIAGSLTFEVLSWPIFMADVNAWKVIWQATTFLYPIERIIIAVSAAFIGASLRRALKSASLTRVLDRAKSSKNV
jgi:hypothetical protein